MLLIEIQSPPIESRLTCLRKVSKMTVYVAQISGRGIVAFDAANEDDARALLADRTLRRDLIVFQNEGHPLWNGVSEIQLREAKPKEAEIWEAGQSTRAGGDKGKHVFLIPIVDPLKFADHHDDDDDH